MDTIRIPLVNGKGYALIDADDLYLVDKYRWYLFRPHSTDYARAHTSRNGRIGMHTVITGFSRVDHENGNGLDNRRLNLRDANASQNGANVKPRGLSRFKGVSWSKSAGCWQAQICVNYQKWHLGRFDDEVEAAQVYDAAAREAWGPFARLNFPA